MPVGVFENKENMEMDNAVVAEHIELLNSYEPFNTRGDICVTQLQMASKKKTHGASLMYALSQSIKSSFKNGEGKRYIDCLITALDKNKQRVKFPHGIDSSYYGFYLDVNYQPHTQKTYNTSRRAVTRTKSSTKTSTPTSPLFVAKRFPPADDKTINQPSNDAQDGSSQIQTSSNMGKQGDRKRKRSLGTRTPDILVQATVNEFDADSKEIVIFEVISAPDFTNIREDIAQLVSFGLSLQQQSEQNVYLHLVLITPIAWGFLVLPPFGMKLVKTLKFQMIQMFYQNEKEEIVLDKSNYIWFLKYMNMVVQLEGKSIEFLKFFKSYWHN